MSILNMAPYILICDILHIMSDSRGDMVMVDMLELGEVKANAKVFQRQF